jgi:hypothetical protein
MTRRVRENSLYVIDRQPEIRRDLGFIEASLPIVNDVIGWHPCALKNRAPALHAGLHLNEWTI